MEKPKLEITPTSGFPLDQVTVTGSGFLPQTPVTQIDISGAPIVRINQYPITSTTGGFVVSGTIPGLAPGTHTVIARIQNCSGTTSFHIIGPDVIFVNSTASGSNSGTSWANAYIDLQEAIVNAGTYCEIWVASGTYNPTYLVEPGTPQSTSFQMKNEVGIYGGFAGTESSRDERDWRTNVTVLSGEIGNPGTKTDNCFHVFYNSGSESLNSSAILDGFVIRDGYAYGPSGSNHNTGGGISNRNCSPTINNCMFKNNFAAIGGGGIYNFESTPSILNCIFSNNNSNQSGGGGMFNFASSPAIVNCVFTNNRFEPGCGQWCGGGGMYNLSDSSPTITNCTFSENYAQGKGGGVLNDSSCSPIITNCIFWEDSDSFDNEEIVNTTQSYPIVTYSNIQGGYPGVGNISGTPVFINQSGGDFHLQASSPCIDAGTNWAPTLTGTDFEGDIRVINGTIDMGIDETIYAGTPSAAIIVNPNAAYAGSQVMVRGIGFVPYAQVEYVRVFGANIVRYDDLPLTDVNGTFEISGSIPGLRSGTYSIIAQVAEETVSTQFEVISNVVIVVELEGTGRQSPDGWQIPIVVQFFSPGDDVLNDTALSTSFGYTSCISTVQGTRAYFQCTYAVNPGTYDVTVDSETTLLNVKRNVGIW